MHALNERKIAVDNTQSKTSFNPFAGPSIEVVIPVTQSQTEIWTACQFGGDDASRAYNDSLTITLRGSLDKPALENALKKVIQRHESLRGVFSADGRFMTVFNEIPLNIHYQDLSALDDSEKEKIIAEYLSEDANLVFDLEKGPLLKVGLVKKSDFEHALILTAHHIVFDGWSSGILLEELGSIYSAHVNSTPAVLPEAERFSSYADQQALFETSSEFKITEDFWLRQFDSTVPQVNMPTDFPRPPLRTFKSRRQDFILSKELLAKIKDVGIKNGCSLVTTLLAAFEVFISQKTGQNEIVVGLPSAGQSMSGKTQLIGHCVNLLPLRSTITFDTSFQTYLKKRKNELFDAYEHQNLSFGQLLQKLSIARDPSRVPLVPVVFNIDVGMSTDVYFEGLTFEVYNNPRAYEAFELFLNASGTEEKLILEWSYNASLFKPSTISQMMASFEEIIARIIKNPSSSIGDIIEEDYSAYDDLNKTEVSYPQVSLSELLGIQALTTPKKLAVQYNKTRVSYENLQKDVNRLAHQLEALGISQGDFVGVSLPRSEKLVITLMAIMQCGAAYVPLDPSYPVKRLDYMLQDSGAKYLITTQELQSKLSAGTNILVLENLFSEIHKYLPEPLSVKVDNNRVAYLLYTSGSTGNPKGVPITHKNLVNFLYSMKGEPGINENDRLLSITTISFDIVGLELFLPLLTGATLVLTNDETSKDARLLLEVLQDENITILQATPTTWQMLLDTGWEKPLPIKALCGGEALPLGLAKKILERVDELWNMYGPTETTIWSAIKKITPNDQLITIGRPIANTQIYILNEQGLPMAPETVGEIAIGGDGVAKGYWMRPDLTADKFIRNTFNASGGHNLYLTGDLGKLLNTGEIQCLGRKDQQVKIRGHRIELEEIEETMNTLSEIQGSVVSAHNDLLTAYVVLVDKEMASQNIANKWKKQLRELLPGHMVPQQYFILNEFPATLNGKVDRKALSYQTQQKDNTTDCTAISTKNEQLVATIWKNCLDVGKIDPDSNFFELGGHSMIAVKAMSLIEKETGKRLPLSALLEYPTVRQLASLLEKENLSSTWKSLVPIKPNGDKTPLFIVHGANYNVLVFEKLANSLDSDQPVYGLQAKGIDGTDEPDDTVEAMAANFIAEIKTVYPHGPYSLAGFSFGGIIAFEMYRQLKAKGEKVKILASLDSYVYPNYYYKNPIKKKLMYRLYTLGQIVFVFLNMFSNKKNFNRRIGLLKTMFSGFYLKLKYGKEKQTELQFNRSLKIDKMHSRAFDRYNIEPEDVVVDLFRASENVYFAHDFKYLGWKTVATKGIRKHMVPGNHNDMFVSPNVEVFAKLLQDTLDSNDSANK
ncbi:MAG: non-ribosomal peptide synthetase [Muricauda sp.]|nr:non-ribosomal peptide synthetase [Allomuricauda sp.]